MLTFIVYEFCVSMYLLDEEYSAERELELKLPKEIYVQKAEHENHRILFLFFVLL